MCLAIPMKIIKIEGERGVASLSGVRREVGLGLIKEIKVGDYVIIHAGFAIQRLDEAEAQRTLSFL